MRAVPRRLGRRRRAATACSSSLRRERVGAVAGRDGVVVVVPALASSSGTHGAVDDRRAEAATVAATPAGACEVGADDPGSQSRTRCDFGADEIVVAGDATSQPSAAA